MTSAVFSLTLGTVIARLADHVPLRTETVEMLAGILLIGGFAAIGCALPMV